MVLTLIPSFLSKAPPFKSIADRGRDPQPDAMRANWFVRMRAAAYRSRIARTI